MPRPKCPKFTPKSSASLGFEAKPWLTANKLRNNIDAAEYKHVVLGLIFLEYISDTFEEHRAKPMQGESDYDGANPEDPDEYKAENVFWVPADARWSHLHASAKQPTFGKTVDNVMVSLERDNPPSRGDEPRAARRRGGLRPRARRHLCDGLGLAGFRKACGKRTGESVRTDRT